MTPDRHQKNLRELKVAAEKNLLPSKQSHTNQARPNLCPRHSVQKYRTFESTERKCHSNATRASYLLKFQIAFDAPPPLKDAEALRPFLSASDEMLETK